jgi:hypothetical protein
LLPAAARLVVRRRRLRRMTRTAAGGHAAWAELRDMLTDLGMAGEPSETPRALGRRIGERYALGPQAAESLTRVVTSEERLRYAPTPSASGPVPADLRRIRRDLASRASRWRRLGAVLAPMSVLLRVRAAGEGALDVFDRLEGLRLWRARPGGTRTAGTPERPGGTGTWAGAGDSERERTLTGARR